MRGSNPFRQLLLRLGSLRYAEVSIYNGVKAG